MGDYLTGDPTLYRLSEDTEFSFSYVGVLGRGGEEESTARWRYSGSYAHPSGVRYRFYHDDLGLPTPAHGETMYLMPRDLAGTVAQLYRRHRAIEGMRSHAGLLDTIADPARTRRDTDERLSPGS
jgi:hypothetical protein